jgi:hypothetical protein
MTISNGYLTIEEAISYVGRNESRDTYELEDVVTAASRMVDRHCGRHFYQATADAREFDVDSDGYTVTFGAFNDLVSVTSVAYDNNDDGVYESTLTASQYQLLAPVQGQAPGTWPYTQLRNVTSTLLPSPPTASGRERLIRITGTWGWPAVPPEVKQATRILVAELAKLQDAPLMVAGFSEFGVVRVSSSMPARARQLLQPFRHPDNVGLA